VEEHNRRNARHSVDSVGYSETIGAHDSVTYPADVDHAIVNVGRSEAIVYLIDVIRPNEPGA
jgi:hypothetical protein